MELKLTVACPNRYRGPTPIDGWRRERLQPDHLLLNCPGKYVKADCPPILVPGPYSLEPAIFLQSKIRKAAVPLFYTTWRHHIGTREYGVVLALASEGWRVGLKKWRGGSGRSEQRTMRSFRSLSVSHNTSPSKTPASGVSAANCVRRLYPSQADRNRCGQGAISR